MKRRGLIRATLCTLLLTGAVVPHSGWGVSRAARPTAGHAKAHDALAGDAAWRWRSCQPTHWRACLLQR